MGKALFLRPIVPRRAPAGYNPVTSPAMLQEPQPTPEAAGRRVEAARYALLRRLAFAMRHHMVVHLQPIGMITEVMERRLRMPQPDLAQVHEGMSKVNGFSRAAVQSCLEVVSWLAPEEGATAALDAGVAECMAMLRSNFNFRGFTLKDETGAAPAEVSRAAVRNALPACLLALTDHAPSPADVVVTAQVQAGRAVLAIDLRPTGGAAGFPGDAPYRLLAWDEVEALANADGVALERADRRVQLTFGAA
jgi:hypothetical protein